MAPVGNFTTLLWLIHRDSRNLPGIDPKKALKISDSWKRYQRFDLFVYAFLRVCMASVYLFYVLPFAPTLQVCV